MRQIVFTIGFVLSTTILFAQSDTLLRFNEIRLDRQQTAMTVLGVWAVGNMATSGLLLRNSHGETKAFHQMNIGWNAFNLAIAGFSIYSTMHVDPSSFTLLQSIQEQQKLEKILLFNAGLDVGYVMTGLYLRERAKSMSNPSKSARLRGFGKSIILQGGFLFAFDLAAYLYISKASDTVAPLINENGIGLSLRF